jgi:hypothetical protein
MEAERYNVECPRCLGTGKFDRGTCFKCKGRRSVTTKLKPESEPRNFVVTFDNGKQDFIRMYFFTREYALKAIQHQMIVRGWLGTITEVE